MNMVRMNITSPEDLARQLGQLVDSRKKSRFIAETLKERVKKIEEDKLQKMLEEGYKRRKEESLSISRDFESIDLEGWDEY
jgi:metal-responsive CopG/Arc/MetJ family transcriptional regulator